MNTRPHAVTCYHHYFLTYLARTIISHTSPHPFIHTSTHAIPSLLCFSIKCIFAVAVVCYIPAIFSLSFSPLPIINAGVDLFVWWISSIDHCILH